MMHPVPIEAVLDDRLAIVGTTGSGKTYGAGTMTSANIIDVPKPGHLRLLAEVANDMTKSEAVDCIRKLLDGPQTKMVNALLCKHSFECSRDELAEAAGYQAGSGNVNNIIGSLSRLTVFEIPQRGRVRLSDWAALVLGGA